MKIYKIGDDILRQKCEPVQPEEINDEFRATLDEMFRTMTSAYGVGLAAPQVGIAKRFFVMRSDDDVNRVFINPEIIKTSGDLTDYDEGCLSIPGVSETIMRPSTISVTALNERGRHFTINDATGLLARIIQHENDHLNGILYIDRGDEAFKEKTIESFKKKAERAALKAAKKAAKNAKKEG
ncbi:MAG: peptide deformylase [Treponema sp.]|nr:peptide deformylase [Treponema sp.]